MMCRTINVIKYVMLLDFYTGIYFLNDNIFMYKIYYEKCNIPSVHILKALHFYFPGLNSAKIELSIR